MSQRGKYDRTQTVVSRRRDQRRALLAAASAVFARVGFPQANVEAVITHAGMSRRTFYQHFDDLHDVLAAVHEASGKFALRYVEEQLKATRAPQERLANGIRARYLRQAARS